MTFVAQRLLRALIGLLVFCVAAQATALSAQRTMGRAHHHFGVKHGAERGNGHENGQGQGQGQVQGQNHDDDHGHRHGTRSLSDHDHPLDDATVVYVQQADDDHAQSPGPASSRTALDLDGLMPDIAAVPCKGRLGRAPVADPWAVESHLTTPLERPPRT